MRLTILPLLLACGPKNTDETNAAEDVAGTLSERTTGDGLLEQQIDLNGDGTADVYNFYQATDVEGARLLVRKEVDLNWDSRIDVRSWFDLSGQLEKEEMDGDFDGMVDWVDHYQGGKRVLSKVDTNYDGQFDLYKIFEGGKVRRKERDTNGDGNIDFWEYLDEAGRVIKTGQDIDGDGVMDIRQD